MSHRNRFPPAWQASQYETPDLNSLAPSQIHHGWPQQRLLGVSFNQEDISHSSSKMPNTPPTKPEHTLNRSLLYCIIHMVKEQKDLYLEVAISLVACIIAGGSYAAQAVIFSRLIFVFTPMGGGQSGANFWALMLFVLAIANWFSYFSVGIASNKVRCCRSIGMLNGLLD